MIGPGGKGGAQARLIALALGGDDDEAVAAEGGQAVEAVARFVGRAGGQPRCGLDAVKAEGLRQGGKCLCDRAVAQDHQLRARQHGFDEHIHRPLGRAAVAGKAHALPFIAGGQAFGGQKFLGA